MNGRCVALSMLPAVLQASSFLLAWQPSEAWSKHPSNSFVLAKPSRSALPGCCLEGAKARDALSSDELKLLQDAGGWEYISISDSDNGIQTQHVCFDGRPHPQECSGTLTFSSSSTFVQKVHIHGQTVRRNGGYELNDDQLSLFDELGTKDGPYTLRINVERKSLVLEMQQVRIQLELEKQYREDLRKGNESLPHSGG